MPIQIIPIYDNPSILDAQESNLVLSKEMVRFFGIPEDYVQLFVYNNLNTLIGNDPNFQYYSVTENKEINFEPGVDIERLGFRLGTYNMFYNFLRPILTLSPSLDLFIKSISSDRKEIKISTTTDNDLFYSNAVAYIDLIQKRNYFIEYYLDFGNNVLVPALSMAVEKDVFGVATVIIKLQDTLLPNITTNTPLNVVEKIVDTQEYQAILTAEQITGSVVVPSLREANFSLDVDSYRIGSSDYYSYNQILNYTGSEFQNLLTFISSSNPTINVDYGNYADFVHFSSISQRLKTFQYKLQQIEGLNSNISTFTASPDTILYQSQLNSIIQGFDDYENYLYFDSGSTSWPKQPGDKPYANYSVTSSQGITWYNINQTSASYYDEFNNNNLIYGLPVYIQESPDFENVAPFVYSMGQMFDEIWLYIKAMTDLWKADNALSDGISKDIVGDALQSLGIKLYTDGDQDNIYEWLYGQNSNGTQTFPTQSWQTGVTASLYTMSGQDEAKSIFKRIYANLPTLLKSKGTDRFVNYLNTLFGIPETILYPMEFGGIDKTGNTAEYNFSKFTYGLQFQPNKYVYVDNLTGNPYGYNSLEFRFKPTFLNTSSVQTLLIGTDHVTPSQVKWGVVLTPTNVNGYDYGTISIVDNVTSSVTLPIFVTGSNKDFNWWNIAWVNEGTGSKLYVKNELNGEVGFSATVLHPNPIYDTTNTYLEVGNINPIFSTTYPTSFGTGTCYSQIQELRGWTTSISESVVSTHTLNPESYVGNTTDSAYNDLLFRFPLGNDLITTFTTPLTGSQPQQTNNLFLFFNGSWVPNDYVSFTEQYYTQPAVGGYSTPNTDKIRIETQNLATTRLQPFKSVVYNNPTSSRTLDIHLTQVGFSPQDQTNNDIIAQLGSTYVLDNIVGDPRQSDLNYYPGLSELQEEYFQKYIGSYNYKDFTQLIETFHKSLFRYLADYVPGRSNNTTGIVYKPHILERSKTRRYEPTIDTSSYDATIETVTIEGSNPGGYCCSRTGSTINEAFFDGEFEGSIIPMDSYYDQYNPFSMAICKCHKYQVTLGPGFAVYSTCGGEVLPISNATGTNQVYHVEACENSITTILGSPYLLIQDLGLFNENQAFKEQYEGWDALNNNVDLALESQYKQKQINQPIYVNPNNICGTCARYEVAIGADPLLSTAPGFEYVDCTTGTIQSSIPGWNTFSSIFSCTIPSAYTPTVTTSSFMGDRLAQFGRSASLYENIEWQDTNLSDVGYVRSREAGTKTTALDFNKTFLFTSSINTYDDVYLGSNTLPNVERTSNYLLYYDWVTSSLAEKQGTSNYHIKYLIDETGSVFKPTYSSSYYWNTDQGFGKNTPVNVTLYDITNNVAAQTSIESKVYAPVSKYQTVIYSDKGILNGNTNLGYFNTMSFVPQSTNLIDPWNDDFRRSGDYTFTNVAGSPSFLLPPWNNVLVNENAGWDETTGTFTAIGTGRYQARVQAKATVYIPTTSLGKMADVRWYLLKNGANIAQGPLQSINNDGVGNGVIITMDVNVDLNKADTLQLKIRALATDAGQPFDLIMNGTTAENFFNLSNSATANTSLDVIYPYAQNYLGNWSLSTQFNSFYNTGSVQDNTISGSTLNSGFSNPVEFELKKYDEVRFEADENLVYTVMSSSLETIGFYQRRIVTFNKPLPSTVDPNYFVVRRLVSDPGFVMIDGNNNVGPGFIIPKYQSPVLKDNLSNIIANLSSKGLIP